MSEAPKTVEEPVVAPTTETPAVEEPVAEAAPAETAEPVTEAPVAAAAEPAKEEEVAAPAKEEVKPVEEGVLGYKGPGFIKGVFFQKKFFWFGTDAVENKALTSYLRGEKEAEVANHNAAWASHTGKGLLFFSKKATDKASPAGIFNLADVTDISAEGPVEFHFTSGGHKHTFQAANLVERDNWLAVVNTKAEEAKTQGESIKDTEEYKTSIAALAKPAVVAPVATPKKAEEPKEEKKEEKAEAKEEKKEEKKARKSRSASRKRASIFGGIGFGKKEEKTEPAAEAAPAPAATEEEPAVEATPATTETPAVVEPASPAEEPTEAAKPTPTKRNSIFGTLKSQFSQNKEKKSEEAPAVPAKDATEPEPVSETAPVIPQVQSTEPLADSVEAAAPAEAAPVTNGETKTETPVVKSDKRKSSIPWLTKKEKPTSDEEGVEKPKSPFAKLRATVKGKSSPKAEKIEKAPEVKAEEPAAEAAPAVEEPVVSEPVPAVTSATPQVSATA
ncbi:hypothetical protein G7Y89_g5566 [Cudoniella acicularis]|uniref:Meiotic expression up-regulated protein 6 PH domain-containing protein n=1 Tax=Cudoniella acicularis TaxID=354080 RepID=A0A8H4W5L7_9HELO|nr:hypothetical protein G7Y89_g5566 [Cudoniella acicularis]